MAKLQLKNITKTYDGVTIAINNFNLEVKEEEFIALVGPSGCGKSTTLRMIAGLEEITSGDLYIDGKRMNDITPQERNVAMVFQNYALYPHMTVYNNLAFNLKLRKLSKGQINEKVKSIAQSLGLTKYLQRKPHELSGGQQQRVALGRAIIRDANIYLMDEPLSNLDAKLRLQMRSEIKELHRKLKATTIYVTHDQTEAMTMANKLVVMNDGVIQQIGNPKTIYEYPQNVFVGSFIGSPAMNFLSGHVCDGTIVCGNYQFTIPKEKRQQLGKHNYNGKDIILGIRPEHINLHLNDNNAKIVNKITVFSNFVELTGADRFVHANLDEQQLIARINCDVPINEGEPITLAFNMNKAHFFDKATEKRIC